MSETRNAGRPTLYLACALTLVVGAVAGFLIAHFVVDKDTAVSTPDPKTVTCSKWVNLSSGQKTTVLRALNKDNDTHATASTVDDGCGIIAGPNDPVSGVVINESR